LFNTTDPVALTVILQEELEAFNTILEYSRRMMDEINRLPINTLANMASYRQEWIEKIKKLEEKRVAQEADMKNKQNKELLQNISGIAEALVEVDKAIYAGLEKRKIDFIQRHSEIAETSNYTKKESVRNDNQTPRIDVVQE
jgi:hypothetical protein